MATESILNIVFSLLTIGLALATFLIGRKSAARDKGKADGKLEADMDYIKRQLESIQKSQSNIFSRINRNDERIARVEENVKDIRTQIEHLEGKTA